MSSDRYAFSVARIRSMETGLLSTTDAERISRADVADFMLKQLTSDEYLRQTPGLSY